MQASLSLLVIILQYMGLKYKGSRDDYNEKWLMLNLFLQRCAVLGAYYVMVVRVLAERKKADVRPSNYRDKFV